MNAFGLYIYKDEIQKEMDIVMGTILALIRAKSEAEVNDEEEQQKEYIHSKVKHVYERLIILNDKMKPILGLTQNIQ